MDTDTPQSKTDIVLMSILIVVITILIIGLVVQSARPLRRSCALEGSSSVPDTYRYQPLTVATKSIFPPLSYNSYSPGHESVANAFDGNDQTKYLNFKGEGSGIEFTTDEFTKITHMILTSANDAKHRDPKEYELYGWIHGKYQLLAGGTINDWEGRYVSQEITLPPHNRVCSHYRLVFTKIREPKVQNIMQIGDIEFKGENRITWVQRFDEQGGPGEQLRCPVCPALERDFDEGGNPIDEDGNPLQLRGKCLRGDCRGYCLCPACPT